MDGWKPSLFFGWFPGRCYVSFREYLSIVNYQGGMIILGGNVETTRLDENPHLDQSLEGKYVPSTPSKRSILNQKSWRFGLNNFLFQLGDF